MKAKKKTLEILEEKECEISMLKMALGEKKSSIERDQSDLNIKCEAIQKKGYSNL